uniref:Protein kinase domain-containing protein n=1 Tax=Caenorhabditis japonica TaxID=281687 RepID=A0A8R1E3G9_CAEJA
MAKLRDQGVKFNVLDAKIYTFQLFCAIGHLAAKKIVHMDVKPQNIILDKNVGKLSVLEDVHEVTRFYRPPELLFGCEKFTSAIDTWSATCVAFEFFANRTLFRGRDTKDQILLITGVLGYPTDEDIKSIGVRRPRVARKEARGIETVKKRKKLGFLWEKYSKSSEKL